MQSKGYNLTQNSTNTHTNLAIEFENIEKLLDIIHSPNKISFTNSIPDDLLMYIYVRFMM